jgi:hypothetical protein
MAENRVQRDRFERQKHPSGTIEAHDGSDDTRLRNLKPNAGKAERLVVDGHGLYVRIRAGGGKSCPDVAIFAAEGAAR